MKRGIIAAICLALCTPAAAENLAWMGKPVSGLGPDHVYVYHQKGNVNYQCTSLLSYFETEGHGIVYMSECQVTSIDYAQWPPFAPEPIRVTLSGPAFKQPWDISCQFVARAMVASRSTSTVIDCR